MEHCCTFGDRVEANNRPARRIAYRRSQGLVRGFGLDQLRQSLTESGEFTKEQLAEYDHWTMLLPEEY